VGAEAGSMPRRGREGNVLGREVGPSQHPSAPQPWSPERYRTAVNRCNRVPERHQITKTWGTNPSPSQCGSPMHRVLCWGAGSVL